MVGSSTRLEITERELDSSIQVVQWLHRCYSLCQFPNQTTLWLQQASNSESSYLNSLCGACLISKVEHTHTWWVRQGQNVSAWNRWDVSQPDMYSVKSVVRCEHELATSHYFGIGEFEIDSRVLRLHIAIYCVVFFNYCKDLHFSIELIHFTLALACSYIFM